MIPIREFSPSIADDRAARHRDTPACSFRPKIDRMQAGVKAPGWSAGSAVDRTQPIRTYSSAGCIWLALDLAPARERIFAFAPGQAKELLQAA
jgi:hypothetical protein